MNIFERINSAIQRRQAEKLEREHDAFIEAYNTAIDRLEMAYRIFGIKEEDKKKG